MEVPDNVLKLSDTLCACIMNVCVCVCVYLSKFGMVAEIIVLGEISQLLFYYVCENGFFIAMA